MSRWWRTLLSTWGYVVIRPNEPAVDEESAPLALKPADCDFAVGWHPRGYYVRMRGGENGKHFNSLLEAAQFVKQIKANRCPILYVPGIEKWLAFMLIEQGFARYESMDQPINEELKATA